MDAGRKILTSQVGGHPGILTSDDGSLLIKPTLPREVSFYERSAPDPAFAPLRPYIPKFSGSLKLEGKVKDGNLEASLEAPAPKEGKDAIVLENLSHRFSKPNILDIKLGTKLYDNEATEEKKARMIKTAKETTSLETGVRLTGFQVYDMATGQVVTAPKSYGRSLQASDLPDGIARFFPVHSGQSTQGLPKELLLPVIRTIRKHVAAVRGAFKQLEMRMAGSSFLIIYEGDPERVKQGVNLPEEEDEDGSNDKGEEEELSPRCVVKLIDFAHTEVVAGEGPDEGVLLGMDTTLKLLDGRISQIKQF